jgi:hypothetical protein
MVSVLEELSALLGNRSVRSIRDHAMRKLVAERFEPSAVDTAQRTQSKFWSNENIEQFHSLHEIHGNNWLAIGRIMGKYHGQMFLIFQIFSHILILIINFTISS